MNSRGKPLTPFENFKATVREDARRRRPRPGSEFAHKIDGEWSDLLWPIHGGDNIVDDEFMRYFEFVTEICEWREDRVGVASDPLEARTKNVFGADNQRATEHLDFLFDAFDVWKDDRHVAAIFESLFVTSAAASTRVRGDESRRSFRRQCQPELVRGVLPHIRRHAGQHPGLHVCAKPPALRSSAAHDPSVRRISPGAFAF